MFVACIVNNCVYLLCLSSSRTTPKVEFLFMFVFLTSVHSKLIVQVSYVWAFCCHILLPLPICYQQNCLLVNWELEIEMLKKLTFPNLIYVKLKMSTCTAYLSIENDLKNGTQWNMFSFFLIMFMVCFLFIWVHCTKMVVWHICHCQKLLFLQIMKPGFAHLIVSTLSLLCGKHNFILFSW